MEEATLQELKVGKSSSRLSISRDSMIIPPGFEELFVPDRKLFILKCREILVAVNLQAVLAGMGICTARAMERTQQL
jgi:hypothetical protein